MTEAFQRFEDAGGDPAEHHLPTAPALDVALHVARCPPYLPAQLAVTRLSAVLARDILQCAFLGGGVEQQDDRRVVLLASKQFVLRKEYIDCLNGLERDAGALIWRDFRTTAVFGEDPHTYIHELRREHEEFERRDLLRMRDALGKSRERVEVEVLGLIR